MPWGDDPHCNVLSKDRSVPAHLPLNGLWLSGLRLDESIQLSWEIDDSFTIDLSGRHPRFRIYAEAEKGRQDRLLPMTPDFAEFVLRTPVGERSGPVFKLAGARPGQQMTSASAGRVRATVAGIEDLRGAPAGDPAAFAVELRTTGRSALSGLCPVTIPGRGVATLLLTAVDRGVRHRSTQIVVNSPSV